MKISPSDRALQERLVSEIDTKIKEFVELFRSQFKTDDDSFDEIYRHAQAAGCVRCDYCGNIDVERLNGRVVRCGPCRKNSWWTAGTVFCRIKLASAWLLAIGLLEGGLLINAHKLHKHAGIAYDTASHIVKTLSAVILQEMGEGSESVHCGLFIDLFCRRTIETPALSHPRTEIEQAQSRAQAKTNEEEAKLGSLEEHEKEVYSLVLDQPTHFDALVLQSGLPVGRLSSALTILDLAGLVERRPGDYYVRRPRYTLQSACQPHLRRPVVMISSCIQMIFKGVSRKYVQCYLAAVWCLTDRKKWHPGALLNACLGSGSISGAQVRNYSSPLHVKMMLWPEQPFSVNSC